MQTVQIKTFKREKTGKSENRKLKQQSLIPAVIYGGEKNINISVPYNEFNKHYMKFRHSNVFYEIDIAGESRKIQTLMKDVLIHPVDSKVRHIDFYELREDRKLRTKVPVEIKGTAAGVKEGGILEFFVRELTIESLPKNIPDSLSIDVSALNINDSVAVKDVKTPEGVRIIDDEEEIVLLIGLPQKEEETVPAEGAAPAEGTSTPATGTPAAGTSAPAAGAKSSAPAAGAGDKKTQNK
jgi:large subunit ribosomal protein L25